MRRKVACDAVYVALVGPWLDARIILGTVFKMMGIPFAVTRRLLRLPGVQPISLIVGLSDQCDGDDAGRIAHLERAVDVEADELHPGHSAQSSRDGPGVKPL